MKSGVECGAANFIATMAVPQKKKGDINSNRPRASASSVSYDELCASGWLELSEATTAPSLDAGSPSFTVQTTLCPSPTHSIESLFATGSVLAGESVDSLLDSVARTLVCLLHF